VSTGKTVVSRAFFAWLPESGQCGRRYISSQSARFADHALEERHLMSSDFISGLKDLTGVLNTVVMMFTQLINLLFNTILPNLQSLIPQTPAA